MKNLRKYLSLILFLFLAGIMNSCMKDDLSKADSEDTATVTLHINDSRSGGTSPVEAGEGIKTLRVIVLDADNKVEFNYKQSFGNETDLQTEKTVTFLGMTTGIKKFYVVANEESLGLNDTDYPAKGTPVTNDLFNKVITNTEEKSYFPKLKNEITSLSLPITGYKKVDITTKRENIIIETFHAVAKIVFKVKNTSSEDITLTGFSLGEFFADQTYLFPSATGQLTGVNYAPFVGTVNRTFTAGAAEAEYFTCYLYETPEDRKSYFTVKLLSDLGLEEKAVTISDYVVKRNTVINIVATISKETSVIVPNIDLEWQVSPWNSVTNNVPSFN